MADLMAKARWHIGQFFFIRFFHLNLNLGPNNSFAEDAGGEGERGNPMAEIWVI